MTGQRFTNNINVLINVSVQFHGVYGLQLTVNDINANFTLGLLAQQRQATLEILFSGAKIKSTVKQKTEYNGEDINL